MCAGTWAHVCAGYQKQSFFLSAFSHLIAFWATSLNILECACWKWRFIIQSVRLQPQDSERGFWAWGRVTINLVKSTDESLSHSYNQRHFRPLFPQRNSCLLRRVLKFYFKNSQHLKAACSVLPRLSLATCFQFSQSHYRVSGCGMSCYLHQIRTQEDLARHACACRKKTLRNFLALLILRGEFRVSIIVCEEIILLSSPLSVRETEVPRRDETQFYAVPHCFSSSRNQILTTSCVEMLLHCILGLCAHWALFVYVCVLSA